MPRVNNTPAKVENLERIAPALQGLKVRCDSLVLDPENARLHPEASIEIITASLKRYGQKKPIVVQEETRKVIAGNGTLEAAMKMGWEYIAANVESMTDEEARGYGLVDNKSAEASVWDYEVVSRLTALQAEAGEEIIGWTAKELEVLRLDIDAEEKPQIKIFSDEQIIEACYAHFRSTGFPYTKLPLHACMQDINMLASSDADVLTETNVGIAVADTYNPHRWHAVAEDKRTPVQTYENDEWFRTSIRKTIEMGGKVGKHFVEGLRYSQGTQACANFRPGFALLLYKRFAPEGATVLDSSVGYGGRLVGFMASGLAKYIGIDPSSLSYECNSKMVKELGFSDRVELIKLPAEDVPHKRVAGKCSFAFTSPPYFRKEHYTDEPTQSWKRYENGEGWRDGFLLKMLQLQYAALKSGSYSIVNISDVKIKGTTYPLVNWTISLAKKVGFTHEDTEEYPLGRVPGAKGAESSSEPVLIFRKQ